MNCKLKLATALIAFIVSPLAVKLASGQAATAQKPPMAEEVFKNVTVLKGIPVDEFMDTMGMFAAALSFNCTDCHAIDSWAKFADETPLKQRARGMIAMVNSINRTNFKGAKAVTCYTCHRGDQKPKVVPSLTLQYSEPIEDANEIENFPDDAAAANKILDKYIQALGGAQKVAALTSFVAKGTYSGYDTDQQKVPIDIYAKAPNQRTTIVHMAPGDSVRSFDGRAAWIASPDKPTPLMALTGGNLDGAKVDAMASFPAQLKQAFAQLRAGTTAIEDREVVGSSRVDLQACKLEYSIVSPK